MLPVLLKLSRPGNPRTHNNLAVLLPCWMVHKPMSSPTTALRWLAIRGCDVEAVALSDGEAAFPGADANEQLELARVRRLGDCAQQAMPAYASQTRGFGRFARDEALVPEAVLAHFRRAFEVLLV